MSHFLEEIIDVEDTAKSKRGFASMSPEKQREIARMGGKERSRRKTRLFPKSLPRGAGGAGRWALRGSS